MSGEQNEEKQLPPSERKLRKAREKGQIAHSRDLVPVLQLLFLAGYLTLMGTALLKDLLQSFSDVRHLALHQLSPSEIGDLIGGVGRFVLALSLPPLIIAAGVSIAFNLIDSRGIVFSLEPISPKLDNLDPAKGLKKIFGSKGLVYLAMNFLRALVILILLCVLLFLFLKPISQTASCSVQCGLSLTMTISTIMVFIGVSVLIASLIFEVPLSRFFFTKDMKMSHSEQKRETKEMMGDPAIQRILKENREKAVTDPIGPKFTSLIYRHNDIAIGVYYKADETAAPMVSFRGKGQKAVEFVLAARQCGAQETMDQKTTLELYKRGRTGQFVPRDMFNTVALHLVERGLLG